MHCGVASGGWEGGFPRVPGQKSCCVSPSQEGHERSPTTASATPAATSSLSCFRGFTIWLPPLCFLKLLSTRASPGEGTRGRLWRCCHCHFLFFVLPWEYLEMTSQHRNGNLTQVRVATIHFVLETHVVSKPVCHGLGH